MQLKQLFLHIVFILGSYMAIADPGNGIVADSKGNIFYTDLSQVWKIDAKGNKTVAVPGVHTHELYMDKNDNLFGEHLWYNGDAANTWAHYVWRLDANNQLEKIIKDTAGFLEWYSFVRDDSGNMYYAERSIPTNFWKISPGGKRTLLGSVSFKDIGRLHVHKGVLFFYNHDDIYTLREGDSIKLFRSNLSEASEKCDRCMESIFSDAQDNIYTAVSGSKVIKKISADRTVTIVHQSSGDWFPTGGVVNRDNILWVMEYNNENEVRVVKASLNGAKQDKQNIKTSKSSFNWLLMAGIVFVVTFIIALFLKNKKKIS